VISLLFTQFKSFPEIPYSRFAAFSVLGGQLYITQDEIDTIIDMRSDEPYMAINDEAGKILQTLTQECQCEACQFLKRHIAGISLH
jgi:hypothetical protein